MVYIGHWGQWMYGSACVCIFQEKLLIPIANRLWYCVLTHSTTQISIGESAFFLVQRHSLLFRTGQGTHCRTSQDTHCRTGQDTHCRTSQDTHCRTSQDTHCRTGQDTHCRTGQGTHCRTGQDTHCRTGQGTHCRTGQDTHHRILYYFSASVEGMILHHSVIHTTLSDTHHTQ